MKPTETEPRPLPAVVFVFMCFHAIMIVILGMSFGGVDDASQIDFASGARGEETFNLLAFLSVWASGTLLLGVPTYISSRKLDPSQS